ncbi:MAG: hypothetical protein JWQ26_1766, partial [Modestobacter sp.]|nr:hypothetical protein [Modestobacter sp.]
MLYPLSYEGRPHFAESARWPTSESRASPG